MGTGPRWRVTRCVGNGCGTVGMMMSLSEHPVKCKAGNGKVPPRLQDLHRILQNWGRPPGGGLRTLGAQAQPTIIFSIRFPRHVLKHMLRPAIHVPVSEGNTHRLENHESRESECLESKRSRNGFHGRKHGSERFACRLV